MNGAGPRVALATSRDVPDLTADDRRLAAALRRRGARAEAAVWDDAAVDWPRFDRVVIRSCWDYHLAPERFLAWVAAREADGTSLWNPPALLRGNVHKSYLERLAADGAAVVPTRWLRRGAAAALADVLAAEGWSEAVVKPAVSASAFRTFVVGRGAARQRQRDLDALLAERDVLVQPLVAEVVSGGEWSLVFLPDGFSHAVLKRPRAGDFRVQSEFGASTAAAPPPPALLRDAEAIVARLPAPWLYARVDGVESGGGLLLMELELIEPALFFGECPAAAERMARAILTRRPKPAPQRG